MKITIEVDNHKDLEWLKPFLEKLAQKGRLHINYTAEEKKKKVLNFLNFIQHNSLKTEKIDIPNREERNER